MKEYSADVVVVGFGGAGGAAALTAHEAGASVLILEKNAEGGGNTKYSGGTMRTYADQQLAADYFETLCEGTTEREVIDAFVAESAKNPEWVASFGAEVVPSTNKKRKMFPYGHRKAAFPTVRGAEGIGIRLTMKGTGDHAGIDLWGLLSRKVAERKIPALCSARAYQLLMDKQQGVTGVLAEVGEEKIKVNARRAVIMTCGGFEYDSVAMHMNYLGQRYYGMCNPANTGDGIRMVAEIGADLWHMGAVAAGLGIKLPEFPCGMRQSIPHEGYIYVDQLGQRFMDEPGVDNHLHWATTSYIDPKTLQRTRSPSFVIFDEDTRSRGPIAATSRGKISDYYNWSNDNSAEVRKGWIKAADNIGDLARQIKVRPDVLQATAARYNLQCVGGYDPDFGRSPETLAPIGRPPFYAMELWPCLYNTQGGARRNARAQILDVRGNPIKRLYSAGEFGSLWNRNYPGAGNVSEALAFGRIAGRNAAAELPNGD